MQQAVRHVDPMGVSASFLTHEISPSSTQPRPLHASEEGGSRDDTVQNTVIESVFSTGVNLLGVTGVRQDESVNASIDGIPHQRRHVVYEYDDGLFVSRALHNKLIVKEKEMIERVSVPEGRHRLSSATTTTVSGRNSGNNRPSMMDVSNYARRAEGFRGIVQKALKYMRRIESFFTAFGAGASLISLLIVRVGNHQDPPLDDPVLLYFAIVYKFNGSLFLFIFLLLLIISLAPLASGLADSQWRHVRRRQRSHSLDNDTQIQMTQQQQQQRRRVESAIRRKPGVRFADQHAGVEGALFSTYDGGVNSVLTESLPLSVVGGTRGESMMTLPYSTAAVSMPPSASFGVGVGSSGDGAVRGTGRRRTRVFTPVDNTIARKLLGRSWINPWRVLLVPLLWLHLLGLVFTVVEIALTEGRKPSEVLTLRQDGNSAAAILLLAVICIRTALLFLVFLIELFQSERWID
ncbi:uncharacterized protein TM35_000012520 [Trypanosoma theileri]|uniref:Transmembrane protein n=1 Tax=Trypanosoma theileri TaxID=67003 RepID=A0A1X0P979_9TRYP|nr:uncharacterized protein TM35_000012520 [Trypanosoma theileri]ORC93375.1 hypothetical protein TM35_000012520 [Trypanosoma theileri]